MFSVDFLMKHARKGEDHVLRHYAPLVPPGGSKGQNKVLMGMSLQKARQKKSRKMQTKGSDSACG